MASSVGVGRYERACAERARARVERIDAERHRATRARRMGRPGGRGRGSSSASLALALALALASAFASANAVPRAREGVQLGRANALPSPSTRALAVSDDAPDDGADDGSTLSSWLAKFTFDLPKQSFRIPYAGLDVTLSAMRCSNVTVGSLKSDRARGDDEAGDLRASVSDVSFTCALTWGVTDRFGNGANGDASAASSGSSVRFALDLDVDQTGAPPLPKEIKLVECQASVAVTQFVFSGGYFATVLNAASSAVRLELSRTLSGLACSGFASGLEEFSGTASGQRWEEGQLARDERAIAGLLRPAERVPFPSYDGISGIANLSASPLVRWLEYMVESYIGAQGPRSLSAFARWIEDQNEKNDEFNVHVVRVPPVWLFDPKTHLPKMSISLSKDVLREVSSTIEGAAFIVYDMKVVGLETATTLRGPSAVLSNSSGVDTEVQFTAGWERVLFNVSGVLDILPTSIHLDPWIEPLIVSFELLEPEFIVQAGFAVNETHLRDLQGIRRANVACLSQTIREARILALDWTGRAGSIVVNPWRMNEPVDESDDSLEASLDALITRISLLVTEKLQDAVHQAMSHQLGSTARNALDEELRRHIGRMQSSTCPQITPTYRRLSTFKRRLAIVLLYAAGFCAGMFVTVMFGYFTLVVAVRKLARWCFDSVTKRLTSVYDEDAEHYTYEVEEDEGDIDDALATPRQSPSRRQYSRASFHSGRHIEPMPDDTSIITESLLGEAEIDEEGNIDLDEKSLVHRQAALCDSSAVPRSAKYGLPILYTMTSMLFLASNLSVGATLSVRAVKHDVGFPDNDAEIFLPEVFAFSLGDTVSNMWKAGVYGLSLLILLFSGIWPYVKIFAMWTSWCLPGFDPYARGRLLKSLDAFGKWSLLDAFVMLLFMVLFHFEVTTSNDVVGFGALTVSVRPQRGFFVFLLATLLSMVLGHVTMGYHRLQEMHSRREDGSNGGEAPEALWRRLRMSATTRALLGAAVMAMMLGTTVALVLGFKAVAIRFTMLGIAGAALGPDASTRSMSLRSVATQVRDASPSLSASLSRLIEWTMLLFAFIVPLLRMSTITIMWIVPLRVRDRRKLWACKEILDAWSALDVMLFSFVAAISQIRQFLAFMTGGNCDALNETLQQLVSGPLSHDHDLCFDVDSSLGDGCWLLAGCVLGSAASSRVLELVRRDDEGSVDGDRVAKCQSATRVNDSDDEIDDDDDDLGNDEAFGTPL